MLTNKLKQLRHFATKSSSSYYVTTPIFYVNAAPHIGHLYSAVIADTICRFQRLRQPDGGDTVLLCTGTDEHGTKIQQAAATHNVPVAKYCDDISASYRTVFQQALIANTDFIRTTELRHKQAVQHFWTHLKSCGHIKSAQYSGWYCVSDETFLTDSQLKLDPATGARLSLESGHPVEWTEETNYMFSLSKIQSEVLHWVKARKGRVRPAKFEKILLDYLSEPLPDVSVSRPANRVHWAIGVPGDDTQTVYVWLDALINYLTSAGYPDDSYKMQWPPNVQVLGKDILKFHGIYWPAFLIAAGLEPPQELFVHSHWTVDGQKMSKSKHNVVDPQEAAKIYTMEGLRYFLLREGVAHSDGNFSSIKAQRILNSELADTLGNLLSRACAKSLNPRQIYPSLQPDMLQDLLQLDAAKQLQEAMQQLDARCAQHYEDKNFYLVVDTVMAMLHAANNFFESARPWELKSNSKSSAAVVTTAQDIENAKKLDTILAMTMDALRLCGIVLQPVVPALSTRLLDKLNVPQTARYWQNLSTSFANAVRDATTSVEMALDTNRDAVLFRRIVVKDETTATLDEMTIKSKQKLQQHGEGSKKTKAKSGKTKTIAQ